jgi:hypothetical protein
VSLQQASAENAEKTGTGIPSSAPSVSSCSKKVEQLELRPFVAAPADPNVKWLEDLLEGAKCWMSAKDICLTTFGKVLDREVRELASASGNVISGQRGYKHVRHATAEEINHAANWLISQGRKMIQRGVRIRRAAHQVFG